MRKNHVKFLETLSKNVEKLYRVYFISAQILIKTKCLNFWILISLLIMNKYDFKYVNIYTIFDCLINGSVFYYVKMSCISDILFVEFYKVYLTVLPLFHAEKLVCYTKNQSLWI